MRSVSFSLVDVEAGLGRHLGRLHETLLDLSGQVRDAVSQAIGQTAAESARQAILAVLGAASPSFSRPSSLWDRQEGYEQRDNSLWSRRPRLWETPEDEYHRHDEDDYVSGSRRSTQALRSRRWVQTRLVILLALAWWSRRQMGRRPVQAALGLGLSCGLALYLGGAAVSGSGSGLALTLLTDALGAAAAALRTQER
jgi:hypothetical protein